MLGYVGILGMCLGWPSRMSVSVWPRNFGVSFSTSRPTTGSVGNPQRRMMNQRHLSFSMYVDGYEEMKKRIDSWKWNEINGCLDVNKSHFSDFCSTRFSDLFAKIIMRMVGFSCAQKSETKRKESSSKLAWLQVFVGLGHNVNGWLRFLPPRRFFGVSHHRWGTTRGYYDFAYHRQFCHYTGASKESPWN